MGVSKLVYGGIVKFDLTADSVNASNLLAGNTAHGADGELVVGTCTFDVNSSNTTANVAEVLATKTFASKGSIKTGTMPNRGAVSGKITSKAVGYTIPQGYHDGSGTVSIDATEASKLISENIKQGITVLGVEGSYQGAQILAQSKSVSATVTQLTVLPDAGFDYLASVTVTIPYSETDNEFGGKTITIG